MQPEYQNYAQQVIKNAKKLADSLMERGFKLITNGTDNHLLLCDIKTSFGIHGGVAEEALDAIGLTMNKNSIPNDTEPPFRPSGLRLGTPAMTTRGLTEDHMEQIAEWMLQGIVHRSDAKKMASLRAETKEFALKFPMPSDV